MQSGEAVFRQLEHAALQSLIDELGSSPKIIAVGGGAFAQANNVALLEEDGFLASFSMPRRKNCSGAVSGRHWSVRCAAIWNSSSAYMNRAGHDT